ncbi:DUF819 domain-containing protein [Bacillus kexueae]|uniref:DUF819 family protein n=1 Tax=Aeribacillus kexueae TaxID=2078952 RepID=UPI001FAF1A6D|nr:DUF819 family protein [Bacillus kexueae]
MSGTLIQPDDTLTLWGIVVVWASVSIYLEQRFEWASKLSGAIIALVGAIVLSNLRIIPTESPVYDSIWGIIVPLAIPLLLFHVNLTKIWRESGKLLLLFFLSSVGTVVGTIVSFFLFKPYIPYLDQIGAMMSASYIGGGVNFAAMAAKLEVPGEMVSASIVADNMMMAAYFLILMMIPTIRWFQKNYPTPHITSVETNKEEGQTLAESFWRRKEISLKDIALSIGTAFSIVVLSFKFATFLDTVIPSGEDVFVFWNVVNGIFGDRYLMLTTFTIFLLLLFPRYFERLHGSQEIGTYFIYLFFVVIGIPASIPLIVSNAPLLFVFVFIIVLFNMMTSLLAGKVMKANLEDIILASNANIGGPTTAAALAIAKGWKNLIGPIMVVGTLGYIIGNYIGTFLGMWFSTFV